MFTVSLVYYNNENTLAPYIFHIYGNIYSSVGGECRVCSYEQGLYSVVLHNLETITRKMMWSKWYFGLEQMVLRFVGNQSSPRHVKFRQVHRAFWKP